MFVKGEDCLTEEQREAVHYFNETLPAHGFLPVRKISEEVKRVLQTFDPDMIRELVDSVADGDGDCIIPRSKTLVRLCWDNLL